MKTILTILTLILGIAIGAVAGNYYGRATILEKMVISTQTMMGN